MYVFIVIILVICSDMHLLVKKPVSKWTKNDVGNWLKDIKLGPYVELFSLEEVDGIKLPTITESDLVELLFMGSPDDQKKFLQARDYVVEHRVKAPTNFWEYRAVNPGYCTFLLSTMLYQPRIGVLYLYWKDPENYHLYIKAINKLSLYEDNLFTVLLFAEYANLRFIYSIYYYFDSRYMWEAVFALFCISFHTTMSIVEHLRDVREGFLRNLVDVFRLALLRMAVISYFSVAFPRLVQDVLFYTQLYIAAMRNAIPYILYRSFLRF